MCYWRLPFIPLYISLSLWSFLSCCKWWIKTNFSLLELKPPEFRHITPTVSHGKVFSAMYLTTNFEIGEVWSNGVDDGTKLTKLTFYTLEIMTIKRHQIIYNLALIMLQNIIFLRCNGFSLPPFCYRTLFLSSSFSFSLSFFFSFSLFLDFFSTQGRVF